MGILYEHPVGNSVGDTHDQLTISKKLFQSLGEILLLARRLLEYLTYTLLETSHDMGRKIFLLA
jgi:hypothetical protein